MVRVRPAAARGHANHGWVDSRFTFSFADYHDPDHMGFRSLRVINEDRIEPGRGFATHPHRDMEILTYVLDGALEHKDSMGNGSVIRRDMVQRMTAGTGVSHSEFNHSESEPVHLLQIWILPERRGLEPGYEEKTFTDADKRGRLRLIASRDGRDGSVVVHQDVDLYATSLQPGTNLTHPLAPGRHAWLQVVRGRITLGGEALAAGDGAALSDEARVDLWAEGPAEALLFDLA